MNLYSVVLFLHLMSYFPEALITKEWNLCFKRPLTWELVGESSWVDKFSFDRYVEKSAVQTTNKFFIPWEQKIYLSFSKCCAVNELLESLDIDLLSFWICCLSWDGCCWLWTTSSILPHVSYWSRNIYDTPEHSTAD